MEKKTNYGHITINHLLWSDDSKAQQLAKNLIAVLEEMGGFEADARTAYLEHKIATNYVPDWEEAAALTLTEDEYDEYAKLMEWDVEDDDPQLPESLGDDFSIAK